MRRAIAVDIGVEEGDKLLMGKWPLLPEEGLGAGGC